MSQSNILFVRACQCNIILCDGLWDNIHHHRCNNLFLSNSNEYFLMCLHIYKCIFFLQNYLIFLRPDLFLGSYHKSWYTLVLLKLYVKWQVQLITISWKCPMVIPISSSIDQFYIYLLASVVICTWILTLTTNDSL